MTFSIDKLIDNNRQWAKDIENKQPNFFSQLATQQSPGFLWIGSSDSRVPANQIVGLDPGELFVHCNVGNVVNHFDSNCMAVLQYAVENLQVEHIIVCGHYGCGAVQAALDNVKLGQMDNWILNIKKVYQQHKNILDDIVSNKQKLNLLCELNVVEQVRNVCYSDIVMDAWDRGQHLAVHGWVYNLNNGIIKDLNVSVEDQNEIEPAYRSYF